MNILQPKYVFTGLQNLSFKLLGIFLIIFTKFMNLEIVLYNLFTELTVMKAKVMHYVRMYLCAIVRDLSIKFNTYNHKLMYHDFRDFLNIYPILALIVIFIYID